MSPSRTSRHQAQSITKPPRPERPDDEAQTTTERQAEQLRRMAGLRDDPVEDERA